LFRIVTQNLKTGRQNRPYFRACLLKAHESLEDTPRFLYLAYMRFLFLILYALLSAGCAARSINNSLAQKAIADLPQGALGKKDVDVLKLTRVGRTEAIAETQLKTAFRLEKVKGEWIVREVRLGHGQWEKIRSLSEALEKVKIEQTKMMLDRIAEAIQKYRENTGTMPDFGDYVTLSDQLSPKYMTPLIRLDAWRQPLQAGHPDANSILILSAGPDGRFFTSDDIQKTISY
jgi:hypothetical protein